MDCMPLRHFLQGVECGMLDAHVPGDSFRRAGVFRMFRSSVAASVFLATTFLGAGAFAATSDGTSQMSGDPVATLAIMAQLEKAGVGTVGQAAGPAERVADAKGNLHVPEDYRAKYRFMGSWAVAADSGSGSKEMHTVYASPGAVLEMPGL
jgi:hypothetical protein